MINNLIYSYPFVVAYVLPLQYPCYAKETITNNLNQFQNADQQFNQEDSQNYYKPYESEIALQEFIKLLPKGGEDEANLSYLDMAERTLVKQAPNLQKFRQIYDRGLHRYKLNYKENERKTSWGQDDVVIFLWILDKYCKIYSKNPQKLMKQDWKNLSRLIPFRTAHDCMFKYLELQKLPLAKNPWMREQQLYLNLLVDEFEGEIAWTTISQKLYKKFSKAFRTPKQCRQHYNLTKTAQFNRAKKLWTPQQDMALLESYEKEGRRWKSISRLLKGRSENAIKNRFTLLMCRYGKNVTKDSTDLNIIKAIRERLLGESNSENDKQNLKTKVQQNLLKENTQQEKSHIKQQL